jgi:rubrerythrin
MGNIFSASEVVEIGIQIEKNGMDFYNTLSKQVQDVKAKEVFSYLAGEEQKHIQVFQGILEEIGKYQPQGLDSETYFSYMNALASDHVFTVAQKGADVARAIRDDAQAIDKGIGFERDSIIFYEGMKKVVPDHDRRIIEGLIKQEQRHLMQLMELKQAK